jgi:hypothetical protein
VRDVVWPGAIHEPRSRPRRSFDPKPYAVAASGADRQPGAAQTLAVRRFDFARPLRRRPPLEQDEGRKRDPSGIATCNPTTGVVETTVFKEQCVGDCIAQHENTHAKDDRFCCKTYADCVKNASGVAQRNACRDKWLQYADANSAATECNAYTVEQQCMNNLIVQNCGVDAKAGKECCDGLRKEQAVVNARQAAFCGGPSGSPVLMPCGVYFR